MIRVERPALAADVGDVVLLRGPNGSGKTSLLRALAGLDAALPPEGVLVAGRDPSRENARSLAALVALSPQHARDALAGLTVEGEFRLRARALPASARALAERDTATLSGGEARSVALSLAEGGAPLLLLDEPAEGLDARGRQRLRALVQAHRMRGVVVAADHDGLLDDVATRVVHLGAPGDAAPWPDIPKGNLPVLVAPEARAMRSGRELRFAALALPSGFHALVGPNGSGKTTRLLQLAGVVEGGPGLRPGLDARLALSDPRATFTRSSVEDELRGVEARDALDLVPSRLFERHPLTLSGGEAQRVSLAKTLGRRARILLLDEPEAHLDAEGRAKLGRILATRAAEGACILAATHDPALLAAAATRVEVAP